MGLDMYLQGKRSISNWKPEEKILSTAINELFPTNVIVTSVSADIGYWRKSNQIHNWFVTNVQDGKDDCGEYEVSREQLLNLRGQCELVLANLTLADTELPTLGGFFFGGVDYDEQYVQELRDTIKIIDNALELDKQWFFSYTSSW
jgi:hypothetical protein